LVDEATSVSILLPIISLDRSGIVLPDKEQAHVAIDGFLAGILRFFVLGI
jgi:hypothetical protein